jgi:hypothetical protein
MLDSEVDSFNAEFDRAVVLPFKRRATQRSATSRVLSSAEVFKAALIYFAVVFGTGFVLGTIRVLWIIPGIGERNAELLEQPLMLIAIVLAAQWIVRRTRSASRPIDHLTIGLVALTLLVVAELLIVLELRKLSFSEYVRSRDPVSATVSFVMLGVFGLMPWLLSKRRRATVRRIGLAC